MDKGGSLLTGRVLQTGTTGAGCNIICDYGVPPIVGADQAVNCEQAVCFQYHSCAELKSLWEKVLVGGALAFLPVT